MRMHWSVSLGVSLLLLIGLAQGTAKAEYYEETDPEKFNFYVVPYVWMISMQGTLGTMGYSTKVDTAFSDTLDKVKFAGMLALEGSWNNKVGLVGNLNYVALKDQTSYQGVAVSGKTSIFFATTALYYRLLSESLGESSSVDLDILAGANFWDMDLGLKVTQARLGTLNLTKNSRWADPIVGLRAKFNLNERWSLHLLGNIGGTGNTNKTWDAIARVGYQIGDHSTIMAGYRTVGVDRKKNGFVFDTTLQGPILGVMFAF